MVFEKCKISDGWGCGLIFLDFEGYPITCHTT
jgi:hypothetical protein